MGDTVAVLPYDSLQSRAQYEVVRFFEYGIACAACIIARVIDAYYGRTCCPRKIIEVVKQNEAVSVGIRELPGQNPMVGLAISASSLSHFYLSWYKLRSGV